MGPISELRPGENELNAFKIELIISVHHKRAFDGLGFGKQRLFREDDANELRMG